MRNIRFFKR
jgi:hypothetical protein